MRLREPLLIAVVMLGAPLRSFADRGALSLEGGGVVAAVRNRPAIGTGDAVTGSLAGVGVGARYALSNRLEVTGNIEWFAPARFYNDATAISTANGTFRGQLQSRLASYSATVGAQYVTGLVWRLRAGTEVGWLHRSFTRIDLVDVSRPEAPTSFGLGLGSRQYDNVVVSPVVGVEWLVSDHLSFAVTPRAEIVFGSPGAVWLSFPLTVSYSWYGLFW